MIAAYAAPFPEAEELEPAVAAALAAGYDYFEVVHWQGPATRCQPVVWPMRLLLRGQGWGWDGETLSGSSHRGDH